MLKSIKLLLAIVGVAFLVGGWTYGHSPSFKAECVLQKVGLTKLPFPKNIICDAMFDLKSSSG